MTPNLNWKEWERIAHALAPEIETLHLDRVVVPDRPKFPDGYLKGEWTLRLTGRKQERALTFSVRPRNPYLILENGKGPRASELATHSAFDLSLGKTLKGARLLEVEAVERERTLIFWFSDGESEDERLGLVLTLIPAQPEAWLISSKDGKVLANSKKAAINPDERFQRPDGKKAPDQPEIRMELVADLATYKAAVESALDLEALEIRTQRLRKLLHERAKLLEKRASESRATLARIQDEPPYSLWADCLKAEIHSKPKLGRDKKWHVQDFNIGEAIAIPGEAGVDIRKQTEKYYHLSKRQGRRKEECTDRLRLSEEGLERLKPARKSIESLPSWQTLLALETELGLGASEAGTPSGKKSKIAESGLGRHFKSKDGFSIWVGRSREDNLELTFRLARGNDIWMHVKGRPGTHVVVPIPPKKSAPLETLLDAAVLAVYYSGGAGWGKTEVDYTFRKYVKRIKDSSEVSYTNNRTLLVEPTGERLKRLLAQVSGASPTRP